MKQREHFRGIDVLLKNIKSIKKLNGLVRTVSVVIESNGKDRHDDPAYYGTLHDDNDFPFSEKALSNFRKQAMSNDLVEQYFSDMTKLDNKRRPQKDMDDASIIMAKLAVRDVLNYILYKMPQKDQPWKKSGKRNLIETETLLGSLKGTVEHNGIEIWKGV